MAVARATASGLPSTRSIRKLASSSVLPVPAPTPLAILPHGRPEGLCGFVRENPGKIRQRLAMSESDHHVRETFGIRLLRAQASIGFVGDGSNGHVGLDVNGSHEFRASDDAGMTAVGVGRSEMAARKVRGHAPGGI